MRSHQCDECRLSQTLMGDRLKSLVGSGCLCVTIVARHAHPTRTCQIRQLALQMANLCSVPVQQREIWEPPGSGTYHIQRCKPHGPQQTAYWQPTPACPDCHERRSPRALHAAHQLAGAVCVPAARAGGTPYMVLLSGLYCLCWESIRLNIHGFAVLL